MACIKDRLLKWKTVQLRHSLEVAGSKQAGPEGARSEREQPVLIHRESQSDSREAAQHQPSGATNSPPLSVFHPVILSKKTSLCVLCALCGQFFHSCLFVKIRGSKNKLKQ